MSPTRPAAAGSPFVRRRIVGWLGILGGVLLLANIVLGYLVLLSFGGWGWLGASEGGAARTIVFCSGPAAGGPAIVALVMGLRVLRGQGDGRRFHVVGLLGLFGAVVMILAIVGTPFGCAGSVLLLLAGVLAHAGGREATSR